MSEKTPSLIHDSKYKNLQKNKELVTSVNDFLKHVQYFEKRWEYPKDESWLWFRGVSDENYFLTPGIYREIKSKGKFSSQDAMDLFGEFVRRSKPFTRNSVNSSKWGDWEWYHLMQHYGLPTRLLDWTEGSLIGLFFSLRKKNADKNPCVWIMDPLWLNKKYHKTELIIYTDTDCHFDEDVIANKYCIKKEKQLPNLPLALLPPHIDTRIVAQKSVFTVHGKREGFEKIIAQNKNPHICKIIIDHDKASEIKDQLYSIGISESALFPDLEGLTREIKLDFNIE
jgi:hypothetical protein